MKIHLYSFTICISLLILSATGCTLADQTPVVLIDEAESTLSATIVTTQQLTASASPNLMETSQVTTTITPEPGQVVFPKVTMSSKEAEDALLELLRTNGNCQGKCIAGIRPDDMTLQDAINIMSQWGMVKVDKNSQGKAFINLVQNPLGGEVNVNLSIGTWTKEMETIDRVYFYLSGPPGDLFLKDDLWLVNRDTWRGFRLDNVLKSYGVPSYIGYFFQTIVDVGTPLYGRTVSYTMDIHYDRLNLVVTIGAVAYYDEDLFICPSIDPHNLGLEINPERPLTERQDVYAVTWQSLTGMDLDRFYQMFTAKPDACISATLEQILTLQPSFR